MRVLLVILLCFTAFTINLAGLLMITNPNGEVLDLSVSLLNGTPFKNFLIPGILLITIVGSLNFIALFFHMQRHPKRYNYVLAGGFSLVISIIALFLFIQSFHWLHLLYLSIGILIILIAYQLKGKWAV